VRLGTNLTSFSPPVRNLTSETSWTARWTEQSAPDLPLYRYRAQVDHGSYYLSWAILVRKSAIGVDGVEGLAEIVGERIGGGDGLPTGLDLDGAVAAGGADELPD
jgi:hypothetical protein